MKGYPQLPVINDLLPARAGVVALRAKPVLPVGLAQSPRRRPRLMPDTQLVARRRKQVTSPLAWTRIIAAARLEIGFALWDLRDCESTFEVELLLNGLVNWILR